MQDVMRVQGDFIAQGGKVLFTESLHQVPSSVVILYWASMQQDSCGAEEQMSQPSPQWIFVLERNEI